VVGGPVGAASTGAHIWESVVYQVEERWSLRRPLELDDAFDTSSAMVAVKLEDMLREVELVEVSCTVGEVLDKAPYSFNKALVLDEAGVSNCFSDVVPYVLKVVALGSRIRREEFLLDTPSLGTVHAWRQSMGAGRGRNMTRRARVQPVDKSTKALFDLPRAVKRAAEEPQQPKFPTRFGQHKDPLKVVNAVAFSLHLRSVADFGEALDDARRFERGDEEPDERDRSEDPSRTALLKGAARLDVVGMIVERRLWHQEVMDDCVDAINCYSDSSPVTGAEIQGMVVDIQHKDGGQRSVILPGGTLAYGQTDAIAKVMTFMWSVFLVFGPSLMHLRYFVDHVMSWTTDFGVEVHGIECPDCLEAFMQWVSGVPLEQCRVFVDWSRRLFWRSIRVCGWNHACGNVAKRIAKSLEQWPEYLKHIRSLCKFWRNQTWREWVASALEGRVPNVKELLSSFTQSPAKWRFETITECKSALRKIRSVCSKLEEAMFANSQEKELIKDVFIAVRDEAFWKYLEVSVPWVWEPLEHIRRWGLICPCVLCNDRRKAGEHHVYCPRNSRRLAEAWDWIQDRIQEFRAWSRQLGPQDCEGSHSLCDTVRRMLLRTASELQTHFSYLGKVPWLLAKADTVDGAAEVVRQINARPLADHDPATRAFVDRVGADVGVRANGGEATAALTTEARIIKHTPLNEVPGEAYHRATSHEHTRAPGGTNIHLKQKNVCGR